VTGALVRRRRLDLDARLEALRETVSIAGGRLEPDVVGRGAAVVERAGQRLGLGSEVTVAALAGATGSGKSSILNALAGVELSAVGVKRPTTGETHACVWAQSGSGAEDQAGPLLDWLGASRRHILRSTSGDALEGLVLLDLPDFDSTDAAHRIEVDRLVELVDLLVWVVDPQKYADAAVHERYLQPLAGHSAVTVVVLNQADRLDEAALKVCESDLGRLLEADGLRRVPLIATSAVAGGGLDELRAELARRVGARRAGAERLAADVARVAAELGASCGEASGGGRAGGAEGWRDHATEVPRPTQAGLVRALADAAGVELAAAAAGAAHRRAAALATGWPFTRWIKRLRPDPLARLHLGTGRGAETRTSLPEATPVQRARVSSGVRAVADSAGAGLLDPWPTLVRRAVSRDEARLPDLLDRAVAGSGIDSGRRPRWWRAVGALQWLLTVAAVVGALWLAALFVVEWLQLPDPPLPHLGRLPVPTLALIGGLLGGALAALVSRLFAGIGARRRERRARRTLTERVGRIADTHILDPLRAEIEAYNGLCRAARRARSGRS